MFQEAIDEAFARRSVFKAIDQRNFAKVDIIVRDAVRDPGELFARAVTANIGGEAVRTISREDLILAKLRWAQKSRSAMQLGDVHAPARVG